MPINANGKPCGTGGISRFDFDPVPMLMLFAKGYTDKEVAFELNLPYTTLRDRVRRTRKKVAAKNITQAVIYFIKKRRIKLSDI